MLDRLLRLIPVPALLFLPLAWAVWPRTTRIGIAQWALIHQLDAVSAAFFQWRSAARSFRPNMMALSLELANCTCVAA